MQQMQQVHRLLGRVSDIILRSIGVNVSRLIVLVGKYGCWWSACSPSSSWPQSSSTPSAQFRRARGITSRIAALVFLSPSATAPFEDLLAAGDVESVYRIMKALAQRGDLHVIEAEKEILIAATEPPSTETLRRHYGGLAACPSRPRPYSAMWWSVSFVVVAERRITVSERIPASRIAAISLRMGTRLSWYRVAMIVEVDPTGLL